MCAARGLVRYGSDWDICALWLRVGGDDVDVLDGRSFLVTDSGSFEEDLQQLRLVSDVLIGGLIVALGQRPLQIAVPVAKLSITSEHVTDTQMVAEREASIDNDIDVSSRAIVRRDERMPIRYPELASMRIAGGLERLDGCAYLARDNDDVDIDDRLCGKTWNRGTANVLDGDDDDKA